MSELVRLAPAARDPASRRVARAGARLAGLGLTTLETAGRVRGLPSVASQDGARERALVLRDAARRVLDLHGIEVEADGPLPFGPVILAANHVSWLDPLVVASLLPCAPVSKLDVASWPVIGTIARELGVVFVCRSDPASGARALVTAAETLAHGVSVLNFPEGTTTDGTDVLPFRPGMFGLALRARVPVVPVALAYDPPSLAWVGDATFLPHYLTVASRRRARAVVRLGTSILPTSGDRARDLAQAVHAEVVRLLKEP
ncbi:MULTISPECIES: 1-acyl-sn-glycerol-3-phosphate acyltransferase [Anaeromyxobacter]|uniref:lysophospholipid acyltransferase family protein n=1 Tax=Anaeromyxobacter TaxID=161492 RepID=UPI001F5A3EC1|nr:MULTISPECIES: lysophospholipid acyltransferase family protein [unclassified Anaeromyxobacter]